MVKPDPDSGDSDVSLAVSNVLRMLQHESDLLEKEQRNKKIKSWSPQHTKALIEIGKAISTVSAEHRKLQAQEARLAGKLTLDEKVDLMAEMFGNLPPRHQEGLLKAIAAKQEVQSAGPKEVFDEE